MPQKLEFDAAQYIPLSQKEKILHEHTFTAQMLTAEHTFTDIHTFTTAQMFTAQMFTLGGRGSDFCFVQLYLYNKQPPKKYLTHGA